MSGTEPISVIREVIRNGTKLTRDHEKLKSIRERSGIQMDGSFAVIGLKGDATETLKLFFNGHF